MSDELALRRAADRAARAQQLLGDETLLEAFTALEGAYIDAWKTSSARDAEGREKLWQAVQIVGKVRAHLETVVANGRLSQREIDEIAAKPRRFGLV